MDMQCAPTGQAKSKAVLPARGGGLKHCKEACALRLLATSFITGPAQQHVDMGRTPRRWQSKALAGRRGALSGAASGGSCESCQTTSTHARVEGFDGPRGEG